MTARDHGTIVGEGTSLTRAIRARLGGCLPRAGSAAARPDAPATAQPEGLLRAPGPRGVGHRGRGGAGAPALPRAGLVGQLLVHLGETATGTEEQGLDRRHRQRHGPADRRVVETLDLPQSQDATVPW